MSGDRGERLGTSAIRVLFVGDPDSMVAGADALDGFDGGEVARVDGVEAARRRIGTGGVDCVVCAVDPFGVEAVDALAGADDAVPVVAVVADAERAAAAIEAGATDICRNDAEAPEFARRVRLAAAVDDRNDLNEELAAARERTDRMLERVDEAFLALDDDWTVTYVNGRAGEMVGRDPDEIVGNEVWEEFPAATDLAFHDEAVRAARDQESVSFEEYYPPLSIWLEVSMYPDSDGISVFMRDVTDRVKLERRGRRLIEATRELMATDHVAEVMAAASEAASEVLGFPGTAFRRYDPDEEVLESVALGATVEDIEDRPTYGVADSPHGRAFRTGETVVEDVPEADPYEREAFSQTMYVPVDEYGVLSVGITDGEFDAGDRQLAELLAASTAAALDRASRHERLLEYERTLDAVAGMVYALDADGQFTVVSRAFADRLGLDREALRGEHVSTVVEATDDGIEDLVAVSGEDEAVAYETRLVTAAGDHFPAEIDVAALTDAEGDPLGTVGVVRDVTELQAARRRIQRERSRFTYLFDNLPDPVVEAELVDGEPVVRQVNDAFESVFGWDAEEIVDQRFNEFVLPADRRTEGKQLDERIQQGDVATQEVRRKTAEGERYFLYRGVAYDTDEGAGFGIYTDISDRKRRQQYLRVVNRVLRHNLRNDLSTIGGYAELVAESVEDPGVSEYARRIVETVAETADLTEDARELQSIVRHSTPAGDAVDAAAVVTDVVDRFAERYPGADLTANAPDCLRVNADEHLERAVEHLVENGIEHNDGEATVAVEAEAADGRARIRVADDGPGIPDHEQVVLAGGEETTQLQHGSGLGLWYVRFVAQSCGGDVKLEPSDHGGSAVVLTVELAAE